MDHRYQLLFIVWRESVEAFLVIGILHAWLTHGGKEARQGLPYLWAGVLAGCVLSVMLGFGLQWMHHLLEDDMQSLVQVAMMLLAALLIVRMLLWMRSHGRNLRQDMVVILKKSQSEQQWGSVFVLAMLAVAREGSEMVVFIQGILASHYEIDALSVWSSIAAGAVLGWGSFLLLQVGGKVFSWRRFFQVTEVILLFLAAGLFVSGMERALDLCSEYAESQLVSEGVYFLTLPLWDTSWLLRDNSELGMILASMTGYRAQPSLGTMMFYLLYWGGIFLCLRTRPARFKEMP